MLSLANENYLLPFIRCLRHTGRGLKVKVQTKKKSQINMKMMAYTSSKALISIIIRFNVFTVWPTYRIKWTAEWKSRANCCIIETIEVLSNEWAIIHWEQQQQKEEVKFNLETDGNRSWMTLGKPCMIYVIWILTFYDGSRVFTKYN